MGKGVLTVAHVSLHRDRIAVLPRRRWARGVLTVVHVSPGDSSIGRSKPIDELF